MHAWVDVSAYGHACAAVPYVCIPGCRGQTNVFLFILSPLESVRQAGRLSYQLPPTILYLYEVTKSFRSIDSLSSRSTYLADSASDPIQCRQQRARITSILDGCGSLRRYRRTWKPALSKISSADTFSENCIWRKAGRDSGHAIFSPLHLPYLSLSSHLPLPPFSPFFFIFIFFPFSFFTAIHRLPAPPPSVTRSYCISLCLSSSLLVLSLNQRTRILGFLGLSYRLYRTFLPSASFHASSSSSRSSVSSFLPSSRAVPSLFSFFHNFASIRSR